jgi:DNA-binding PadR family transcriptional regulator
MIRHAMLALLRDRPDYGYSLKHRFDRSIGRAWQLNVGQVYQTLQALARAGFVREVGSAPETSPCRRVYEITPKGGRALDRWLKRPIVRVRPVREELLLRLLCLPTSEYGAMAAEIELLEEAARQRVDELRLRRARLMREGTPTPVEVLALAAEMLQETARVDWLAHCRSVLASWPTATATPTASAT